MVRAILTSRRGGLRPVLFATSVLGFFFEFFDLFWTKIGLEILEPLLSYLSLLNPFVILVP